MIEIINHQSRYHIRVRHFRRLVEKLISFYQLSEPVVNLVFSNNRTVRQLNRRFRKKDRTTDVLSFPLREKGADGRYYLGDIIISVPQAYTQCLPRRHGLERELEILTIHGFLHLLGYDHGKGIEEEEARIKSYLQME